MVVYVFLIWFLTIRKVILPKEKECQTKQDNLLKLDTRYNLIIQEINKIILVLIIMLKNVFFYFE